MPNVTTAGRTTALLVLAALLAGCATTPTPPPPDLAALMRGLAAEPYRYGGTIVGTLPGGIPGAFPGLLSAAAPPPGRPPAHLAIGLDAPAPDGTLRGRAVLFDADRRFLAQGPVSGRLDPGFSPGTSACRLRVSLPGGPAVLSGICTADTLSGEVVSSPPSPDLSERLLSWWGDRAVGGRYWLDRASFDPPA